MLITHERWTNGNRSVAVCTYGSNFHAEAGVFDGVRWQWRTMGKYKAQAMAVRRIQKEMSEISQGWTAQPAWTKEV